MRGYRKKMSVGYARSGRAPLGQRCAVRVTYTRNKNAGQWRAHGHYLARERATEKREKKVPGFSRSERNVDIAQRLDEWQKAGDERLFKIIVSPEFGDRIDLENHTRELMAGMERDLKTELEWVAVIHYNTEHPHAHIALRGIDHRGKPLRLPREYVKSGIRSRAEDLITKELGHRTIEDAIEALDVGKITEFILPRGSEPLARLHWARTVARRAERRVVGLSKRDALNPELLQYMNRLSSLLYQMAVWAQHKQRRKPEHPTYRR